VLFVKPSVADPDPGLFLPPESGIRIRDEFSRIWYPGSDPFFDEMFICYLQSPCYVFFITLA
jgi:hypothetical protein